MDPRLELFRVLPAVAIAIRLVRRDYRCQRRSNVDPLATCGFHQRPARPAINAYVMQDEARHVMFGRLALRDFYPQLTQRERDEREEFCVDACYRMRDRFLGEEVWERLGLPVPEVVDLVKHAELQLMFRGFLFTRIVPVLRDIGLWGPRIRGAFDDMGVLAFADADIEATDRRGRGHRRRHRPTATPTGTGGRRRRQRLTSPPRL